MFPSGWQVLVCLTVLYLCVVTRGQDLSLLARVFSAIIGDLKSKANFLKMSQQSTRSYTSVLPSLFFSHIRASLAKSCGQIIAGKRVVLTSHVHITASQTLVSYLQHEVLGFTSKPFIIVVYKIDFCATFYTECENPIERAPPAGLDKRYSPIQPAVREISLDFMEFCISLVKVHPPPQSDLVCCGISLGLFTYSFLFRHVNQREDYQNLREARQRALPSSAIAPNKC
ncbi:hypothetical protein RRG08_066840 [Elysia crispata]|uniref:Uncharacterized protein n=1 Tax=Elysia crispata TaxID=231223 RepID=A0AAE0XR57_9GAST|nr:hypothetical protein RRG08_066840 [Elysia crispata]